MIRPFENIFPDETYEILEKGAKLPVGTVRSWGNKEYVKVADKKWVLKKDIQLRLSTEDKFFDKKTNEWSKERQKLHKDIIDKYTKDAKKSNNPTVILMMGAPGSGKGTIQKYLKKKNLLSSNFIQVDPDEIKTVDLKKDFDEYGKFNRVSSSKKVHEEGSYLAKQIINKLSEKQSDFLIDKVFAKEGKLREQIDELVNKGYKVKIIMAKLPKEIGFKRALEKGKKSGRYINKDHASNAYDTIDQTFENIYKNPPKGVVGITQYDTNVNLGEDPKLIKKFEK